MSPIGTRSAAPDFLDTPHGPAACAGTEDDTTFFPEPETSAAAAAAAALYCHRCPLYRPCRAWALAQPPDSLHGIWAGTSRSQRRWLRPRRSAS
ncbi:WhiB family transcriptional regulator [Micromonospora sp. RTGN7]|uniref:WhiB family transcriptional regulator n=1 Tax=Micromonospora sp. RTGN7 TaxID=3016526 RepID=UPI0029FF2625|nr:WhiB family transcriptional regulator [Micromonospora sp. RTGN7]